jgi:hypothetical protein
MELSEMSYAQTFLKFFPLHRLEPLFPKWNVAAQNKQSPVRGFHTIDRAWFVGWLALWIVMMIFCPLAGCTGRRAQHAPV